MRLFELFPDEDVSAVISQEIMDILTPMMATSVPFVTVDQIVDRVRELKSGMAIDRSFVMNMLTPEHFPIVKKIEGDRIYLDNPASLEHLNSEEEQEKDEDKIKKDARKKALDDAKGD